MIPNMCFRKHCCQGRIMTLHIQHFSIGSFNIQHSIKQELHMTCSSSLVRRGQEAIFMRMRMHITRCCLAKNTGICFLRLQTPLSIVRPGQNRVVHFNQWPCFVKIWVPLLNVYSILGRSYLSHLAGCMRHVITK